MTQTSKSLDHFRKLLADFDTAMLITINSDNRMLHARPMRVEARQQERSDDVWFITGLDSEKIRELERDSRACVVMMDGRRQLVASGYARVVFDRQKLENMWHESLELWFPDGPGDPRLALIQVRPEIGEYWDNSGLNGIRFAFEAAKAWIKDEKIREPQEDPDESRHGKVALG